MASQELLAIALRLLQTGAWIGAESAARAAMQDDPDDLHARLLAGIAVAAMGEAARAAPLLTALAASQPDADHPCLDLVRFRPALPRPLITRQFQACLRLEPDDARLRLAFADYLLDSNNPEEAEAVLCNAAPSAAAAHLIGMAQAEQNRFQAAIGSFRRAVALDPGAAASWSNLGMMHKVERRFPEAFAAHEQAVSLDPENPRMRVNRAVARLQAGDWTTAWPDYEYRLDLPEAPTFDRARLLPSLRPGDSLIGTTVLALHEDGVGDTLQFLRYLPLLAQRGARVIAWVPKVLERILLSVPSVTQVVTGDQVPPEHDFVCPMFSLPRVFGTKPTNVPPVPPLALDPALIRHWRGRLPDTTDLLTGLVWAGQARPSLPGFRTLDQRRSAGLAAFRPLADVKGVKLVSLQAGQPARQFRPAGMTLLDPMPMVTDFADTAAIIANLDLVVSVDTSVVHLAGLMNKPVFLLDRYDGCWRWLSGRADSPWYPRLTIFRQEQPGDWSGAMDRAAAALLATALYHGSAAGETRHPGLAEPAFVARAIA
jgi:uncharacterized protein (TIGR02996 family)